MKLTLDRSGLLVASIHGVTALPELPTLDLDDTTIDADYRKRIIEAVLEFRAQQTANAAPRDAEQNTGFYAHTTKGLYHDKRRNTCR